MSAVPVVPAGHRVDVCFHGVGEPRREREDGEARYWVGTSSFHRILDEIAGWPRLRISFDDGNVTDVEHGLPALQERGLTATFFVLAGRLDRPGSLSTADLRELDRHGMSVQTHGMDHRSWRGMDAATSYRELVEARDRIAEAVGRPVTEAAMPLGRYDRASLGRLRDAGYDAVYSSDRRLSRTTSWLRPRFSVVDDDTPDRLRERVFGPQPLPRRLRTAAVGVVKRLR